MLPPSQQQVNATVPSRRGATLQVILPTTSLLGVDGDPFVQTPSREKPEADLLIFPVSDVDRERPDDDELEASF